MYSKSRDRRPHPYGTPPSSPRPLPPTASPRTASSRTASPQVPPGMPSYHRRVNVPPNYSGLAIVDGEERALGEESAADIPPAVPPAASDSSVSDTLPANRDFGQGDVPEPRFDDLEQVSGLAGGLSGGVPCPYPSPPPADTVSPPTAPRGGGWLDLSRFPFGHGIGAEEWLLVGLILLLLHEAGGERGDLDETVILLALLLLGG